MGSKNSTKSSGTGGRGSDRSGQQETNRRKNEVNPNIVKAGTKKVKEEIKKSGTNMYGGVASKTTNEYLVSIGEAKRGNPYKDSKGNITGYSYRLTSKGHKMKYGTYNPGGPQNPTGMGTVGAGGIMNQIPISEKMFEQQKKFQAIGLAVLSLGGGPIVGSVMRAGAADAFNSTYGDYQKSFNAKFDPLNANTFSASNKQNNTETANLAMGETTQVSSNKKSKSKTTKNTSKYFAGMGVDESTKKRTFYV